METGPRVGEKDRNQENLLWVHLEITALPQTSKLSEKLQWMQSAPISHQCSIAASINNTSCIYKAFVFQHSLICIEPTRFENTCGVWPLSVKEEKKNFTEREKKIKIRTYLNIQHPREIVQLCCFLVTDLTWGITVKPEVNATQKTIKWEEPLK